MSLRSLIRGTPLEPLARPLWQRLQRLWRHRPGAETARYLPGIDGRVHVDDAMLYDESEAAIHLYLRAARSAVEVMERALAEAGRSFEDVRSCLDFGCGHGRVLRLLVQRIPPRRITACDIHPGAVRFCQAEFGVLPLVSHASIERTRLRTYDLIWVGSVLTHVQAVAGEKLLRALGAALRPGGLIVFSLHGQFVLDNLSHFYDRTFADEAEAIRQEVRERGVSFRPYGDTFGPYGPEAYGMTFHSEAWLTATVDRLFGGAMHRLLFLPRGWDEHHDVLAFQRTG
jgi:SAM-dependent methyltransferase